MARLNSITIENYRSISGPLEIKFPERKPLILIGENNAGKSNIVRAIDLLFGEYWPGSKTLEDHEHWQRKTDNTVYIQANVSEFKGQVRSGYNQSNVSGFSWQFNGKDTDYKAIAASTGEEAYVNNELRGELTSLIVNADHNLAYQLSYASKWTLLSKVMRAFHQSLTSDDERVKKLKELFENIKTTFNEVPEFKKFASNMSDIAGEMIGSMTHALDLDFSAYDPSNYFRSLQVSPSEAGEARSFEELGTGQQQILALTFAHAYSKSFLAEDLILVLDEPEAHLHPLAQKWLANIIYKMAEDGLQVVVTTHSPHFIDLNYFEGVCAVRKNEDGTEVIQHTPQELCDFCISKGSDGTKTRADTVVPFYANSVATRILDGFFAKKIVLVEGLTEELALPIYFRRLGLDCEKEGIDIISVHGKGNIARWWRLFSLFEIPTFVCFDNDNKSDDTGERRKDALKSIGIPETDLENLLSSEDWSVNQSFCVFGKDFETTMRNSFSDYQDIETQKKEELGSSAKHIIAKETAKSIAFEEAQTGWKNMSSLAKNIKDLGKPGNESPDAGFEDDIPF